MVNNYAMKRTFTIIALAALALGSWSCAVPDDEFVHDDATISAIKICTTKKDSSGETIKYEALGVIDQEAGTIKFTIPKENRREIDLDAVKFRANVGLDAYVKVTKELSKPVDRTLYGIHDVTEGIEVTVLAKMTGRTKDYYITAKYAKE